MSASDRDRWDRKHASQPTSAELTPNAWLIEYLEWLPRGRALDLASGLGHSAIELARRGYRVAAIDISLTGLRLALASARRFGVQVQWIAADLDQYPLPRAYFDLVTVFYYLDRGRLPGEIIEALRPGGMLVYETYTMDQLRVPGNHITNPDFLLRPGELLHLFSPLRVRHYRDVVLADRAVASLVAEKVSGEW